MSDPVSREEFQTRLDAVDARFDAVDARFEAVDARFDAMDGAIEARPTRAEVLEMVQTSEKNVRNDLTSQISMLRVEMNAQYLDVRSDMRAGYDKLDGKLDEIKDFIIKRDKEYTGYFSELYRADEAIRRQLKVRKR